MHLTCVETINAWIGYEKVIEAFHDTPNSKLLQSLMKLHNVLNGRETWLFKHFPSSRYDTDNRFQEGNSPFRVGFTVV